MVFPYEDKINAHSLDCQLSNSNRERPLETGPMGDKDYRVKDVFV